MKTTVGIDIGGTAAKMCVVTEYGEVLQRDEVAIQHDQPAEILIENIEFKNANANCVFRSNHASNYLPIKGILARDKDKIISTINYGLNNPEILRPTFYRGL